MIIGVPKEIKKDENRIAVTPAAVSVLVQAGHKVIIQKGAGLGSGIADLELQKAGAEIVPALEDVYQRAEMIYKVKEPQPEEYPLLQEKQILFAFLHLAAEPDLTRVLMEKKVAAVAYETVEVNGNIPMLAPMSEVAGRMATQLGAHFLEKAHGGKGILLGGVPGVTPGHVVIIGGGIVGLNAAKIAIGMGARVTVLDNNPQRLRYLDDIFGSKLVKLISNSHNIAEAVAQADLLIGAVLIPGSKAPKLVSTEMVKSMQPGSVIIDVAVDQGGCIATIDRRTSHSDPVYTFFDVLHYAVPNIPGAVPRTSTFALSNVTLPYALELANKGLEKILAENVPLARGCNIIDGKIVCKGVAEAHSLPWCALF